MRQELLIKLEKVLNEDIVNEYQVVYILSRIRKYLELKNQKSQYKILNFYCNWALHCRINRTESMGNELHQFIGGADDGSFLSFKSFRKELERFLEKNNLPTKITTNNKCYTSFIKILVDIYQDTPLEVYLEQKRVITISKTTLPSKYPFSISFTIQ